MDSPQKKAGSTIDADCKTPHLLPVPVSVTMAKKATASRPTPFPDAVRLVSIWALSTACFFLGSFAIAYAVAYALDLCVYVETTDADGDDRIGLMYCAAPQAAAAALALLLPGRHHRVRRALACLSLAVAIVGHYMFLATALCLLFVPGADPGQGYFVALDILIRIGCTVAIVIFPAGDLVSFLLALSSCREVRTEDRGAERRQPIS